MIWGTGHELDEAGDAERIRDRHLTQLVGTSAAETSAYADHRRYADIVLDQSFSLACVWHAVAMAMFMRGQVDKTEGRSAGIPFPSIMQAWVLAQWEAQADDGVPADRRMATNAGSRVSAGLRALHVVGIASASRWPFDLSLLQPNERGDVYLDMPIDVDVAAADARLNGDYGASSADAPRIFRTALDQKHFPVVAMDVCQKFFEVQGPDAEYLGREGRPSVGRHMMVVVGKRPGDLLFKNSYGDRWGDRGYVWIPDEYIASPFARDGAVITAVPRVAA